MDMDERRDNEAGNRDEAANANHDAEIRITGRLVSCTSTSSVVTKSCVLWKHWFAFWEWTVARFQTALTWRARPCCGRRRLVSTRCPTQLRLSSSMGIWKSYPLSAGEDMMRPPCASRSSGKVWAHQLLRPKPSLCVEHGRAMLLKVPNSAALRERFRSILVCMKGCTLHRVADSHNTQSLATHG